MKDHYHTLKVPVSATQAEIKKAFRQLALQHHPDKQADPILAADRFAEIYEAYSVLSDKKLRAAYHSQRNSANPGTTQHTVLLTAEDILQSSIDFREKVYRLDPFRTDRDLLHFEILYLLSDRNIRILHASPDPSNAILVAQHIMQTGYLLSYTTVKDISPLLKALVTPETQVYSQVTQFVNSARRADVWNRYKTWIALVVALAVCWLIFLFAV